MNNENNCSNENRPTTNAPYGVIEILCVIVFIGIIIMMFIPSNNSDYANPVDKGFSYTHSVK